LSFDVYDYSRFNAELRREFDVDESPKLDENWREAVYAGEVEVFDEGFAWDENFSVVAHGVVKDGNCGKFKGFSGCLRMENHAKVGLDGVDYTGKIDIKRYYWSCNRPECPKCGVSGWAVRLARRVEAILKFASAKLGKVEHLILSPPQDLDLSLEELRALARKALLVRGVEGGCMVYHHFRYHHKDETYVGEPARWFKAPHFHVLGFIKGGYGNCRNCRYMKDGTFSKCREGGCNGFEGVTRRAYLKDGFIAKVKGERKTIGGTIWYELSHASLRRGVRNQNVLTWFGECNRHKLKIPKGALPQRENLCRICGEPHYRVDYHGNCRELLFLMDNVKRSESVILDLKDANGKMMWSVKHKEKYKDG
jgi:hypothetical protein